MKYDDSAGQIDGNSCCMITTSLCTLFTRHRQYKMLQEMLLNGEAIWLETSQ